MKPFKGLVIKPGSAPPELRTFTTFEQIQQAVEGLVDRIGLREVEEKFGCQVDVLINDEGKDVLPVNAEATKLLSGSMFWGDYVCGPVVLAGERNGTWIDVPERLAQAIVRRGYALSRERMVEQAEAAGFQVIVME
jgi:hypothetical protein